MYYDIKNECYGDTKISTRFGTLPNAITTSIDNKAMYVLFIFNFVAKVASSLQSLDLLSDHSLGL